MDDNHFLIEWLAYHYQVLPLRRLIIARDPRSRTVPSDILKRWQGLMNITEWRDDDYFHAFFRHSILTANNKSSPSSSDNKNHSHHSSLEDRFTILHRHRQRFFFAKCMKTLKMEMNSTTNTTTTTTTNISTTPTQSSWVALLDSDEFLTPNRNWKYRAMLPTQNNNTTTTIAHLLRRLGNYKTVSPKCIGLPRLLFGTKEDSTSPKTTKGLMGRSSNGALAAAVVVNASNLLTLRWKWRAALNSKYNKAGKTLIDLSRVSSAKAFRVSKTDVHRPVKTLCEVDGMWTPNADSPLVVHHYIGSYDQWMFRHDPRGTRTREKYMGFQKVTDARDDSIQGWIDAFVRHVGPETARRLLQGVGVVDGSATGVRNASADLELLLSELPDFSQPANVTRLS
jgi:hypothetical protein